VALGAVEVRGHRSFVTRLLTPRWISTVGLIAGGAALGEIAWLFLPYGVYTYFAALIAPVCMAVAVAAWAMRDKADDTFDPDYLAAAEYRRSRSVVRDLRGRSLLLAALATVCAAVAGGPVLSAQTFKAVWEWMAILSGMAIGLSVVCFQVAFSWEEQLRAHRERLIADAKAKGERNEIIARIERSQLGAALWREQSDEPTVELTRPH
jgi:hypothetical protein